MTELLTAAQMRAIEKAAIESGAVTGLELMERAGKGVVDAIFAQWPALATTRGPAPAPPRYLEPEEGRHRAVVLCGPGNNGGDGFVVARLLRDTGWAVEVFLYGDAEKLPPDARANYERWVAMGRVAMLGFPKVAAEAFESLWGKISPNCNVSPRPDIVVDAIFGTGLTRPPHDLWPIFDLRSSAHYFDQSWVSVDLPSGLCSDSGKVLVAGKPSARIAPVLGADLTVTFHRKKHGHILAAGPAVCGHIAVVDIGLPEIDEDECDAILHAAAAGDVLTETHAGQVREKSGGHKYDNGHALILSGGVGKGGAARMAARGALRIGTGAVTVGCPPAALIENAAQLNAVMLQRIVDTAALTEALEDARINALCLGPGMGTGAREAALVRVALASGRCSVLDADALTLLSRDADLFGALHDKCVLTPHAGEFARLFPDIAEKLDAPAMTGPAYSKVDATREAAKRAGCVVLFKGPDTVIADPSDRCSINAAVYDRSAPWLATAGAGDVLAGFITGLLARGFAPMQAAEAAAWLHVECARTFGPGLIAEDLPEALPGVLNGLGL